MRAALPNAAFIGFTGTPLIAGQEERTREVFGDYVSIYNFAQSIADGATVPLYYESRKPELQLANESLRTSWTRCWTRPRSTRSRRSSSSDVRQAISSDHAR